MPHAALALDIDQTLTTADPVAVSNLSVFAEAERVPMYVNTARVQAYCDQPDDTTLTVVKEATNHFCRPPGGDPVYHKVANMKRIAQRAGVDPRCAVLVDDRPENVFAVEKAGFQGVLVDGTFGITDDVVEEVKTRLSGCRPKPH